MKKRICQEPILHFIVRRLVSLVVVLLGVTFLTYGLMYLSPSDPVEMLLQAQGIPVSEEVVLALKQKAGLNRPFLVQYVSWLAISAAVTWVSLWSMDSL